MFRESQKIGVYTLIHQLGQGGFGEVWLAENSNHSPSEKVAIKLPRTDQIDLQAFKEEIFNWNLAGRHKNILPIIECETLGNQIAIVSEYAPDGSLQDLINKKGSLSVSEAVEITVGILDGLAHLHNRKIIHRDLKPDNVVFQGNVPRLTDFGISRALPKDSCSKTISGTMEYMALECFDGKRNEQTDIWSVGATLYQLLTGKLPYPQRMQEERIFALVMKEPEPMTSYVPPALQKIVMKALARNIAERYRKANDMAEELHEFSQEHSEKTLKIPSTAIPPTEPSPKLGKPILKSENYNFPLKLAKVGPFPENYNFYSSAVSLWYITMSSFDGVLTLVLNFLGINNWFAGDWDLRGRKIVFAIFTFIAIFIIAKISGDLVRASIKGVNSYIITISNILFIIVGVYIWYFHSEVISSVWQNYGRVIFVDERQFPFVFLAISCLVGSLTGELIYRTNKKFWN